jgi:hypothetical protein
MEVGKIQVSGLMSRPIYLAQAIASGSVNDVCTLQPVKNLYLARGGVVKFANDIILISVVLKLNLKNFSAAASSNICRTGVSSNGIHSSY